MVISETDLRKAVSIIKEALVEIDTIDEIPGEAADEAGYAAHLED